MTVYVPYWVLVLMATPWAALVVMAGIYAVAYVYGEYWWRIAKYRELAKIVRLVLRDEDLRDELFSRIPKFYRGEESE